jgi:hypothetical protein
MQRKRYSEFSLSAEDAETQNAAEHPERLVKSQNAAGTIFFVLVLSGGCGDAECGGSIRSV